MNEKIPEEILELAKSAELGDISEKIGNQNDLHIDQIGELDAQIRHVLRGFSKSANFTDDIMKYLEIDRPKAEKIATEVNAEIFQKIKELTQKFSNEPRSISSIEQAGGFNIENSTEAPVKPETVESPNDILSSIENPQPGSEKISRKESSLPPQYTEPLVDQLLGGSVAQPQQKVVEEHSPWPASVQNIEQNTGKTIPPPITPKPITPPTANPPKSVPPPLVKREGPDPYREELK